MKKIYILFFAFFICLNAPAQEVQKIRIDPTQAYGGSVSEYFNSVEYIPLETTKESLFGDINSIIITDSSYVIYDLDTKSVFFFSLNGKFICKRKYSNDIIPYLVYQRMGKKVLVSSYDEIKMQWIIEEYTQTGFKKAQTINKDLDDKWLNATPLGTDGSYLSVNGCYFTGQPVDSTHFLLSVYNKEGFYKSFFAYNQKENQIVCQLTAGYPSITIATDDPSLAYVSLPADYAIYEVTKDTAIKLYQLLFPKERTFPKTIIASDASQNIESEINRIKQSDKIITKISNIFFSKDNLFFKLDGLTYRFASEHSDDVYNFFYNLKSGRLSAFERITPDSTNYYLPLWGNREITTKGLYYSNSFFYASISSLAMFAAYEKNKSKNPQYPPVLQQYFKTQNRKSNLVIVKMKLRE
jgi:hypothetical protein